MCFPQLPRWLVAYCFLVSLCILLIKYFESHSSSDLLQDLLDHQIQHGTPINFSSHFSKLDPLDASTYLSVDALSLAANSFVFPLMDCSHTANPQTSHIRLTNQHLNISLTTPGSEAAPGQHFNPTILRLPPWATKSAAANGAKYVLVTRAVTEGLHQESLICLADICLRQNQDVDELKRRSPLPPDTRPCDPSDVTLLGARGGMRCTTPPIRLNIPPTPALRCTGPWSSFPHIAGFHDPRIFWSNRGEPRIILNSASQYGCVGLWVLDLRTAYPDLEKVLSRDGKKKAWELPATSYSHLTELTRIGRSAVEKNWMFFFPGNEGEAIIQYDALPRYHFGVDQPAAQPKMNDSLGHTKRHIPATSSGGGRTMARVIGAGHTTPNITHPDEMTCFPPDTLFDVRGQKGHWHQATNALKLILCTRQKYRDGACGEPRTWTEEGREVHFSIMHRKFSNNLKLPMRYERYVVVWEGRRPYRVIGVSKWPILFEGERAQPWSVQDNWPEEATSSSEEQLRNGTILGTNTVRTGNRASNWTMVASSAGMAAKHGLDRREEQKQAHQVSGTPGPARAAKSTAYFTYTPSISWAWRPTADHFGEEYEGDVEELERLGMGFLGDDLLVGIGMDDVEQVFVRMKVDELVSCLRLC